MEWVVYDVEQVVYAADALLYDREPVMYDLELTECPHFSLGSSQRRGGAARAL